MKKFEKTEVVRNIKGPADYCFAPSAENIAIVSKSAAKDSNVSIPRRHQELGLPYGTLWRILHLDLHLYPYQIHLTQQLKPADHSQRREWVLAQQAVNDQFFE